MSALKEMFNDTYFKKLVKIVSEVYPKLDKKKFYIELTDGLEPKSLNERMRHTSQMLRKYLPENFKTSVKILDDVIPKMDRGYTSLVFPDFIGLYGLDDHEFSLRALKHYTSFGSSEFAIRMFLRNDLDQTISTMYEWAKDSNPQVRRLASEGSRPRLPWSFKLDEIIKNPKLTTPILNTLKADPELYVRKSVANHLNDISKENPDYMLSLIQGWDHDHAFTSWIIKHGSRTLIKKGHTKALTIFKVGANPKIKVREFKISPATVLLGESIELTITIQSAAKVNQKILIDYILHYVKKSGGTSSKVFKLKEFTMDGNESITIKKRQRIIDFTTRKHYPGKHKVDLQVNGKVIAGTEFKLKL
ncbi:MAG: DNA alkylation repair protein [Saprospiraceae bacterium]